MHYHNAMDHDWLTCDLLYIVIIKICIIEQERCGLDQTKHAFSVTGIGYQATVNTYIDALMGTHAYTYMYYSY